ncbi:MAG: LysR family transcriptional regulator [Motiliproteus sp.]
MNPDELKHIDLNLLVAFNALMDERNVSRAAERMQVTQPAMSRTLQRLRDLFQDPLFIRTPKGLDPTARSLELRQPVTMALGQLITLLTPSELNPATLDRTFTLAMADPFAALLTPPTGTKARAARPQGQDPTEGIYRRQHGIVDQWHG